VARGMVGLDLSYRRKDRMVRFYVRELSMVDDKSNRGAQDRSRVSGSETYEVEYFARKHGITKEQAEELIEQHGNSPAKLDEAAEKLKSR
jgi:hypothetical protein